MAQAPQAGRASGEQLLTREAARPAVVPAPSRAYWVGQSVVVATFFVPSLLQWRFEADAGPFVLWRSLVTDGVLALVTVVGTHRLRPSVLAEVADLRGLPRRLPRRLGALALVALAISLIEVLVRTAIPASPEDHLLWMPSDVALNSIFWSLSLALWCMVYGASQLIIIGSRSTAERLALAAAAREAEARVLRAQMDPHFLFNAINSARALVSIDPDGARDLLTRYAEVLRYVTTHARGTAETMGEALSVATAYLEIERRRFPDRLRVDIAVPDELYSAQIPTLLLQTLVENAVRHGIARSPGGGTIRIHARAEDGVLTLTVSNPAPPGAVSRDGSGVGLANSRERLRLLHGEAGRLEYSHGADGTVRVSVQLPLPAVPPAR